MVVCCNSLGLIGLETFLVEVESDVTDGVALFDIVGLPDTAVKESRDRVRAAVKNSGFEFPFGRITVNLAPADIKKEGPIYDLPIFVSLLKATGQIAMDISDSAFLGELSLSGAVRRINGVLPMALKASEAGLKKLFIPKENASEGAVVKGIEIYPVKNVQELILHLLGKKQIEPESYPKEEFDIEECVLDFAQVKGQYQARRALEIACAGGHNVLLIGPPGSGKSMLAKRVPSILPEMSFEESIETTKIHSITGLMREGRSLVRTRPFRSPHHTISPAGLSGGGTVPRPGEISLAHNGVLFLDELPEFNRNVMEVLRQPIEDGVVTISRVSGSLSYPCSVMLIAAMNPCPCGYYGHANKKCTCSENTVRRYLNKVSGPLLDRLDLHVEVPAVEFEQLSDKNDSEPSSEIKKRVDKARSIQNERYKDTDIPSNSRLTSQYLRKFCPMEDAAVSLLKNAFETMGYSARAHDRVLKVSRTIADLDSSDIIKADHIAEAVQYRNLDRKYWD